MFGFLKPRRPSPPRSIRDTLFGDGPLEAWPPAPATGEPWATFLRARDALLAHRTGDAIAAWLQVVQTPELESRHYLQAWHFLRAQQIHPPEAIHKQLLGVVLEVPVNGGLDLLAAYPEHTARYYNYSGAGVIWERSDGSLDAAIDDLLQAGQRVLDAIGPWEGPRPPAPPADQVRLNFLSPAGLHFGQGAMETLQNDPLALPVINAGVRLMQGLIAKDRRDN